MRIVTLALVSSVACGVLSTARAADLDYGVLRGPDYETAAPIIDWNGLYVGGHGGYTSASLGFTNTFQSLIKSMSRESTAETDFGASSLLAARSTRTDGTSFGAFAGFNYQFDETVVGIEVDYTRFDRAGSSDDAIARFKTNSLGYLETVGLSGSSSTRIEDYGTIRARGGYAFGNFLPFVTGGIAIGRAQVADRVSFQDYGYDQATYKANQALTSGKPAYVENFGYKGGTFDQNNPDAGVPATRTVVKTSDKVVAGLALGTGLEYALTQNIILRGEYQYILFNDFDGHKVNLNTVRGGAAVKF